MITGIKNFIYSVWNRNTLSVLRNVISENFYIKESEYDPNGASYPALYSKIDNSYFSLLSMANEAFYLVKLGITEQFQTVPGGKVVCIGFNPVKEKWYSWSHRAIFGFGVGSNIKKGDCGYVPKDFEDQCEYEIFFWHDKKVHSKTWIGKDEGVYYVKSLYNNKIKDKSLHGNVISRIIHPLSEYGKGEWEARSLDDAKQMAIDFAKSVS